MTTDLPTLRAEVRRNHSSAHSCIGPCPAPLLDELETAEKLLDLMADVVKEHAHDCIEASGGIAGYSNLLLRLHAAHLAAARRPAEET